MVDNHGHGVVPLSDCYEEPLIITIGVISIISVDYQRSIKQSNQRQDFAQGDILEDNEMAAGQRRDGARWSGWDGGTEPGKDEEYSTTVTRASFFWRREVDNVGRRENVNDVQNFFGDEWRGKDDGATVARSFVVVITTRGEVERGKIGETVARGSLRADLFSSREKEGFCSG
ncbi:hypothetical protein VNO80_13434 [Phaseolus coccineus]|uniref:Uncharacterized protein n=1 Tax=Phaseolus coccineus TaxID=3886 RepID=A0AAN9N666_PHACN